MADHLIEQITDKVMLVLKAAPVATVAAADVFRDRTRALDSSEFPCLVVQDSDESPPTLVSTGLSAATGRIIHRTLVIDIVAYDKSAAISQNLNLIQKEVEMAMAADNTLGGLALDTRYGGRQRTTSGEGKEVVGGSIMSFVITFRSGEKQPDVAG
jgi:hypothetical protein